MQQIYHSHKPSYWHGYIVTRIYEGDLSNEEYSHILSVNRMPDGYNNDGIPMYHWSDWEYHWIQRELDKRCIQKLYTENIACNAGRTNLLNYVGNTVDQGVRYFSVGTGAGTPAATDTAMFTDYFRKAPTTISLVGNQILIATNFTSAEANTTYTEAGLIGGSTAVVTPGGAGTLFAHSLYSYTKTSSVSLTNDYYIALT
jgi:hypothetical protein